MGTDLFIVNERKNKSVPEILLSTGFFRLEKEGKADPVERPLAGGLSTAVRTGVGDL